MGRRQDAVTPGPIRPQATATVFLVDEDSDGLRWLDVLLQRWGVEVLRYRSAEQFLESLGPDSPGVLIVDVDLPGISGLELHRQLAQRGYRLPTIVVARSGDVPLAVRALKEGAADFLEKPVVPQMLLRRVRQALALAERPPKS